MNFEKEYYFKTKIEKRWSDLDEFSVVNNATTMTYLEEARIHFFNQAVEWEWKEVGLVVANANINYRLPITYPDHPVIYLKCSKVGTKSFTIQYTMAEITLESPKIFVEGETTLVCFDFKNKISVPIPASIKEKLQKLEADHQAKYSGEQL